MNGLFIPAHIDRPMFSVFSQLNWIPDDLKTDGLELFHKTDLNQFQLKHPNLKDNTFIKKFRFSFSETSKTFSVFNIYELTFDEIRKALHKQEGRFVQVM